MRIYLISVLAILLVTAITFSGTFTVTATTTNATEELYNCTLGEERFTMCGNTDCQPSCTYPSGPKFCDPKCHPGCICLRGLIRKEADGKCIPFSKCPQGGFLKMHLEEKEKKFLDENDQYEKHRELQEECRKKGEMFDQCGPHENCERTCRFPQGSKTPGAPRCPKLCVARCVCLKNLLRRKSDEKCVPFIKCQVKISE